MYRDTSIVYTYVHAYTLSYMYVYIHTHIATRITKNNLKFFIACHAQKLLCHKAHGKSGAPAWPAWHRTGLPFYVQMRSSNHVLTMIDEKNSFVLIIYM